MDSYYCPLHDPYPTPSYYYPSYIDQSSPTTNYYTQPSAPTQNVRTTPVLNTTFQSSMDV